MCFNTYACGLFNRRWLRVFEGELSYYKPDDLEVCVTYVHKYVYHCIICMYVCMYVHRML